MAEELKACPFCYPHPACGEYPPYITQEIADSGAWCVHAPCCDFYGPLSSTKEEAARKWNTRAQLPSQGGEAVAFIVTDMNGDSYFAYDRQTPSDTPLYTHPADQVADPDAELVALLCEAREFAAAYVNNLFFGANARKTLSRIDARLASLESKL